MEHDDMREILTRLEALEGAVNQMRRQMHDARGDGGRDRDRDGDGYGGGNDRRGRDGNRDRGSDRDNRHDGGGIADEKRIVDLIVHLVAESVDEIVTRRLAQFEQSLLARETDPPEPPAPDPSGAQPEG